MYLRGVGRDSEGNGEKIIRAVWVLKVFIEMNAAVNVDIFGEHNT